LIGDRMIFWEGDTAEVETADECFVIRHKALVASYRPVTGCL